MNLFIRMRDEIDINFALKVRTPMACCLRNEHQTEEDARKDCRKARRTDGTTAASFNRDQSLSPHKGELQCVLYLAGRSARHASGAFHGSDLHKLIDRNMGRANSRTLSSVDPGLSVPTNLCRPE
jgi:hypothetical protein